MARLDPETKLLIVQRLACFDTPTQVSTAIKEDYGITVSPQACEAYDPTKRIGKDLSQKLRKVFEDTREGFLNNIADIPIANKAVRLRTLQRMIHKAESKGNMPLAAQLLEQAAKEVGEAYTNRQRLEHTGKDGGPIETEQRVKKFDDAELEARIKELEGKVRRGKG